MLASVVITLATSFTPNVDWAAHAGGTVQGVLWGIVLLSNELDNNRNKMWGRVVAGVVAVGLIAYSLYYMIGKNLLCSFLYLNAANYSLTASIYCKFLVLGHER